MARPANIQLIDGLKEKLRNGTFGDNSMLPSERLLAKEFGVGRTAVRTALTALRKEGLLQIYPCRGARILRSQPEDRRLKRVLVRYEKHLARAAYEIIEILSWLSIAASKKNIEIILSLSPDKTCETELIDRYYEGAFDGIIFIYNNISASLGKKLASANIPYAVANDESGSLQPNIAVDFRSIGRLAGQRLIQTGTRKTAVLGGCLKSYIFKEMLAGFRGALAEEEIFLNPHHILEVPPMFSAADLHISLKKIFSGKNRPNAVFAMRDFRAEPVFRFCDESGLRIPEDIEIIAYDNLSWPEGAFRGLTTISQPVEEICCAALEMLEKWHLEKKRPPSIALPGKLVERTSLRSR